MLLHALFHLTLTTPVRNIHYRLHLTDEETGSVCLNDSPKVSQPVRGNTCLTPKSMLFPLYIPLSNTWSEIGQAYEGMIDLWGHCRNDGVWLSRWGHKKHWDFHLAPFWTGGNQCHGMRVFKHSMESLELRFPMNSQQTAEAFCQ